jgi:hypothetical protein
VRFSVKLAPGVRLSASTRGLRAHVGPRAARLHLGGGRAGLSSGAGPVSFYSPLGPPQGATRSPRPSLDAHTRSAVPASTGQLSAQFGRSSKDEEGAAIAAILEHLRLLHGQRFAPASKPVVAPPALPAQAQILSVHLAEARRGVSVFNRTQRREAEQSARWSAYHEINAQWRAAQADYDKRLELANDWWRRLQACDPDTVWEQLGSAFADNEAAAAPLAVRGTHAALAVLLPPVRAIPDKQPGVTASGNTSLRKMTKTQTAAWYQILSAGFILTTADEAFAVAPGLRSITLVGLRPSEGLIARSPAECVIACTVDRDALAHLDRTQPSPLGLSLAASAFLTNPDSRTGALKPLDLRDELDLLTIVDSVDLDDFEGQNRAELR